MQNDHSVLVVGTPEEIGASPNLDSVFSFALTDSSFRIRGQEYSDTTDVLLAHGRSPEAAEQSDYFAVSPNPETAVQYAADGLPLTLTRGRYHVLQNGRLTALGQFGGGLRRTPPANQHRSLRGDGPIIETEHLRVYAVGETGLSKNRIREFVRHREQARSRVQALLRPSFSSGEPVNYFLFPDAHSLGTLGIEVPHGTMMIFPAPHFTRWNAHRRYVDVVPRRANRLTYLPDAVFWARDAKGQPDTALLEVGVAVASQEGPPDAPSHRTRAARLKRAGLVPRLDSLLSKSWRERSSPLLAEPLAGAFVDFLLDRWGRETFRRRYETWSLKHAPNPSSFKKDWHRYLDRLATTPKRAGGLPPAGSSPSDRRRFQKGVTIAYANGPVKSPNGYASPAADSSQAEARRLGANAVAIVPYSEIPDADTAVALLPRRHTFEGKTQIIGGESDASIAHAILDAHKRNLNVTLKPQLGAHVEWPGAIQMDSEAEWDRFFQAYRRWIVHYALLAQRYDAEQLAIGTELIHAARRRPDWWRETIAKIRRIYDGSLTYAAHWGNADRIPFWDALDVIGINAYAPLSENQSPSDSTLLAGAKRSVQRWAALHRRTDQPVVLTEAGAPNRAAAWTAPYAELENRPVRPRDQARTYAALIEAIKGETWIRGVYWWRWPVSSPSSGPFDIRSRPAADTLKAWYRGNR